MIKLLKLVEVKMTNKQKLDFIEKTGIFKIKGGVLDWNGAEYMNVLGGIYYVTSKKNFDILKNFDDAEFIKWNDLNNNEKSEIESGLSSWGWTTVTNNMFSGNAKNMTILAVKGKVKTFRSQNDALKFIKREKVTPVENLSFGKIGKNYVIIKA